MFVLQHSEKQYENLYVEWALLSDKENDCHLRHQNISKAINGEISYIFYLVFVPECFLCVIGFQPPFIQANNDKFIFIGSQIEGELLLLFLERLLPI